jgi:hypothetical protein
MKPVLRDPWDRQLEVIADRLGCDPETALYPSLALTLAVTWHLDQSDDTTIHVHSPSHGNAQFEHESLYTGQSDVPPDVGLT